MVRFAFGSYGKLVYFYVHTTEGKEDVLYLLILWAFASVRRLVICNLPHGLGWIGTNFALI